MEKKILRTQLYTLFILTTLNLIYFYYRDNLPDNYYEIAYQNQSINFFSYYFFSLLANFGYWCGIWVTISFVTFAVLHSFVLNKKKDFKNQIVIVALLPLTLLSCYVVLPETLGEGLFSLLKENVSSLTVFSSVLILGLSFFYLVSEKKFFKTCNFVWNKIIALGILVKNADYSAIKSFDAKKYFVTLKLNFEKVVARLRNQEEVKAPSPNKLKITGSPKISEVQRSVPVEALEIPESVEEIQEEETEEEDEAAEDTEEEFIDSQIDESENSESDESDELEDVESPFQVQNIAAEDMFFESEELINCITQKNQLNQFKDPDDQYFEKIARSIEDKLKEFNINSQVINVLKGPVVDTFELELGAGVKVTGVTNRTDDLSLALMGAPIRMVYPM